MKRAVSVSLGSSERNKRVETTLFGQKILLERIGADGSQDRMRELFLELDGQVDAFGFGGSDLAIEVQGRNYPLYSVQRIVAGLSSPVVDGGTLRAVVERETARQLSEFVPAHPRRVLFCVGVARYAMVRSFLDAGYEVRFGDLAFGLGLPIFLRSLSALHLLSRFLLPVMGRVPFEWLYPTGEEQNRIVPRYEKEYGWAAVIADDFHYIKQHLPDQLEGKIIVTNTTTETDVEILRSRGVSHLITVTPRIDGRSFGTNMMEAALTAVADRGRPLQREEIRSMLRPEDMTPDFLSLQS